MTEKKTLLLEPTEKNIKTAGRILSDGGLVAIPTETVYGLAASVWNEDAAARIFEAKGRPGDNPLIVHICELDQLDQICFPNWNAYKLAKAFWPGPLTMILPKKDSVSARITAGLSTVAVRMPSHPAALAVIKAAGVPLAAPSANLSGKPSPTSAEHVMHDLDGKIDAVIDGGRCEVGVESTVVDVTGSVPTVLRPGAVTRQMIAEVLGSAQTDKRADAAVTEKGAVPSPGMKYRHYAPNTPARLFCGSPSAVAAEMAKSFTEKKSVIVFEEYVKMFPGALSFGKSWDHAAHEERVYDLLRKADGQGSEEILISCPREAGAGAAAVNRLKRACGQRVVKTGAFAVIGVTGPSGSGKSTLTAYLRAAGCAVMDADRIYAELVENSAEMNDALKKAFPAAYANGRLDRRVLAAEIFSDRKKRLMLNGMTHPFVARETERRLSALSGPAVLDVPLLFESGMDRLCTCTIGVYASRKILAERIAARDGLTEEQAALRLSASRTRKWYADRCEIVIGNNGTEQDFYNRIEDIVKQEKII